MTGKGRKGSKRPAATAETEGELAASAKERRGPEQEEDILEELGDDVDVDSIFERDDRVSRPITRQTIEPMLLRPTTPTARPSGGRGTEAKLNEMMALVRSTHLMVKDLARKWDDWEAKQRVTEARIVQIQETRRDIFTAAGSTSTSRTPHTATPHTAEGPSNKKKGGAF